MRISRNEIGFFNLASMEFLKRRKFLILSSASAIVTGGYFTYRIYNSEYVSRKSREVQDFFASFSKISNALAAGSQLSTTITNDLQTFLESDSDELPRSIRQLLKLSKAPEFQQALSRITGSVTLGIYHGVSNHDSEFSTIDSKGKSKVAQNGYHHWDESSHTNIHPKPSSFSLPEFLDKVVDKLFSDSGRGFASLIVSRGIRSLVHAYLDHSDRAQRHADRDKSRESSPGPSRSTHESTNSWQEACLQLACSERGKALLSDCISSFTVSAVTTFIEKTKDVNMYDDIVSSVTRPEHREPVKDLFTTVCSEAVDTLVKASHEVLTLDSQRSMDTGNKTYCLNSNPALRIDGIASSSHIPTDIQYTASSSCAETSHNNPNCHPVRECTDESDSSPHEYVARQSTPGRPQYRKHTSDTMPSWMNTVQQLCLVPEFRQLFLSVIGTMSAQGTRALIFAGMDVMKSKSGKSKVKIDQDSHVGDSDQTVNVEGFRSSFLNSKSLNRIASKTMTAASVCVALCLHALTNSQLGYSGKGH